MEPACQVRAQFGVILLFTPLYTAPVLVELKERRVLDFLLVTELSDHEIVLGLFCSRLAKLGLVLLAGLPILSLLELLGGIAPTAILGSFASSGFLALMLGGLSIVSSVHSRTTFGAIVGSYILFVALGILFGILSSFCSVAIFYGTRGNPALAELLNVLLLALIAWGTVYACCRMAITGLRAVKVWEHQAYSPAVAVHPLVQQESIESKKEAAHWHNAPKRSPGNYPLLWKESRFGQFFPDARTEVGVLALILLAFMGTGAALAYISQVGGQGPLPREAQVFGRGVGMVLLWVALFLTAISAAGRVARERQQQTLESLLTLPVSHFDILFAKWVGSLSNISLLWALLGAIYAICWLLSGMSIYSVLMIVPAVVVYSAFAATVGLWFSITQATALRAAMCSILVWLAVLIGPGLISGMVAGRFAVPDGSWPESLAEWALSFMSDGLSPNKVLWNLCFRTEELTSARDGANVIQRIVMGLAGLHYYVLATIVLWLATIARFRAMSSQ